MSDVTAPWKVSPASSSSTAPPSGRPRRTQVAQVAAQQRDAAVSVAREHAAVQVGGADDGERHPPRSRRPDRGPGRCPRRRPCREQHGGRDERDPAGQPPAQARHACHVYRPEHTAVSHPETAAPHPALRPGLSHEPRPRWTATRTPSCDCDSIVRLPGNRGRLGGLRYERLPGAGTVPASAGVTRRSPPRSPPRSSIRPRRCSRNSAGR